jgi:hypothetical protein
MPNEFTPLVLPQGPAGNANSAPFQVTVLPQVSSGHAVLLAKCHLSGNPLPGRSPSLANPPTAVPQPTVTVQRDGNRITLIRIECVCGQVIEMGCDY